MLYFGIVALSLPAMAARLGQGPATASLFSVGRALQGALMFPLGMWWLSDERRIGAAVRTVLVAASAFAIVNCVWVFAFGTSRAGIVWWVSDVKDAIGSPNEAATALLIVWVLVQAMWAVKPRRWLGVFMGLVVVMLPLTQSRSGLLAFVVFLLMVVRRIRWRWVLVGLVGVAVALVLVPESFLSRMHNSLSFRRGTFEVYSVLVRIYGFRTAWHAFLDHPVFGVGYLGLRVVSPKYNEFGLAIGAENYFLEVLVGLGMVGLAAFGAVLARLFLLGRAVRRAAAPKTLGAELARLHVPFLVAVLVGNLTGDNLMGLVGVGQLALWCALLVRAGQVAVSHGAEA